MTRNYRADRVLLVDDDRMSREVLALLLTADGYHVECADSGDSALDWLRGATEPVSVVLTDVQMPGLAGAELSAALRELCGSGTVLLAMSGSDVQEGMVQAFDGFLLKPFRARELAEALRHCRSTARPAHRPEDPGRTVSAHTQTSNGGMDFTEQHAGTGLDSADKPAAGPLDERIYRQLSDSMPALQVRQMYGMCIDDVRRRVAQMRGLVDAQQTEQFTRQAHAIKGGCGMLGASELYRIATDLERRGIPAAGPDSTPGVNPLDELAAACDRLERILATRV